MKKTYEVTIIEELTYVVEVEAESDVEAEMLAFESEKFGLNIFDSNDAKATNIKVVIG